MAHGRDAVARDDDGHPHLRGLHHHFAGQPPCRVEGLVAAFDAVHAHPAGDGVDGVVAAHVLDEHQHLAAPEERTAVHRARLAVDAVLLAHRFQHAVQRALADARAGRVGQTDGVQLRHRVAEYRALAAAGGDHAVRGPGRDVMHAAVGAYGGCADVPVHGDRFDFLHRVDEALVAQVAQHQQFGALAQRHQRHQLALVDEDRQGALGRNVQVTVLAVLVEDLNFAQQLAARRGQARRTRHAGPHDDFSRGLKQRLGRR